MGGPGVVWVRIRGSRENDDNGEVHAQQNGVLYSFDGVMIIVGDRGTGQLETPRGVVRTTLRRDRGWRRANRWRVVVG